MLKLTSLLLAGVALPFAAAAQTMEHDHYNPSDTPAPSHAGHDMAGMDHSMSDMPHHHAMTAQFGTYAATREASGTAWQPDSSPMMAGRHFTSGDWQLMAHGYATLTYSDQGGPRGDDKTFSQSMFMLMANRDAGERGRVGLRAMLSLDPLMGDRGYPLLFATGETADGVTGLVDRQHPHDFFMELSASYAHDLGNGNSLFLYAGLPGEPALGPPTYMHRVSGFDNPEAPIGHHWSDSTHITFGVVTAGFSTPTWKLEASAFRGREPDEKRWDIETPKLNSWSVRTFWNPTANLSFQASHGFIKSPEQLHPDEDERRTTVSATYNRPFAGGNWATTVGHSWKDIEPGAVLDGSFAETAVRFAERHTVFARGERVEEAELFDHGEPLHDEVFPVRKLSVGYAYTLPLGADLAVDVGGLASAYGYAKRLEPFYGDPGVKSFMLFARLKLAGM